ncbi:MAG: CRISPR-associated helicase Cas3' [Opitutales bacterium]
MPNFYAHSHPEHPEDTSFWEPLFTEDCGTLIGKHCPACANLEPKHGHLNKVAYLAGEFAAKMFPKGSEEAQLAKKWGLLAGWWHDLGKFAPEWQDYLKSKADPHRDDISGKVDHSTAGAQFANSELQLGQLMSYLIAGHHAGLDDGVNLFPKGTRFDRKVNEWKSHARESGVPMDEALPVPPVSRKEAGNDAMAFMLRYFFSCLVDADFLATEAFMQPDQFGQRAIWQDNIIEQLLSTVETDLGERFNSSSANRVNKARNTIQQNCRQAAARPRGFFTLTVPTGGGKTLSSLLFALLHAKVHGLRRVIYVIPYTSIITQNADVFRQTFETLSKQIEHEIVLEHHSKFDPKKETESNRLASENWDAPIIVTTNVRFFESLFANRTSACRKLHRIARSVIIFDEAQALPSGLLNPILRSLRCLVHDLGSSAVLCTATQPAIDRREQFDIGIPPEETTEIIENTTELFRVLERVSCQNLGSLSDEELTDHILKNAPDGCLLIVNTTIAASALYRQLASSQNNVFHLSARMCPRHVMHVLAQVKHLRKHQKPVTLIATQLIEAGVDVSFPVVYRAECGLDSFAQAAGRCNRNGELTDSKGNPIKGRVFYFKPTEHPIPEILSDLTANAAVTRTQIIENFSDSELLSPAAIRTYFKHAVWQAGLSNLWDKHAIVSGDMPCFAPESTLLTNYSFKTAAQRFRLIESQTHSVFIPWGPKGRALEEEIRSLRKQNRSPNLSHYRRAQQFTVQVYEGEWKCLKTKLSFHCEEVFAVLDHFQNDYDYKTGLKRAADPDDPSAFIP